MPETTAPRTSMRRQRSAAQEGLPAVIRLIQSDDLAAAAIADITAGVVMVRSSLDPAARRQAVRMALSPAGGPGR